MRSLETYAPLGIVTGVNLQSIRALSPEAWGHRPKRPSEFRRCDADPFTAQAVAAVAVSKHKAMHEFQDLLKRHCYRGLCHFETVQA